MNSPPYAAEIRWTTHGVPHITADSYRNLGFGQGYAIARDHLGTICDQILKVQSGRAAALGRGTDDVHLNSDFGYLALGVTERATALQAAQPTYAHDMVEGYAAGLSAWLADHGRAALPQWCRDAQWVRPVSAHDMYCLYVDVAMMASGRNLAGAIGAATSPADPTPPPPLPDSPHPASNGWALGKDATSARRGAVVANPHFPWSGEARFWECHLTIAGELDVYGAALVGSAGVQIGFNSDLAWTHTFSRGHRFTLYKLALDPTSPTSYLVDGERHEMVPTTLAVEVAGQEPVSRTLWSTRFGPIVSIAPLGWTPDFALACRDANANMTGHLVQWLDIARCHNVGELRDSLKRHQGIPWVNTIAADSAGDCLYTDTSPTPALSDEAADAFVDSLANDPLAAFAHTLRVALLDGSTAANDWQDHPDARSGLLPPAAWPAEQRNDWVFNSNDPYWLAHSTRAHDPLSPLFGLHGRPVTPRTRMNIALLEGRFGYRDSDGRWDIETLLAAMFGNDSLMASQLCDALITRALTSDDPAARDLGRVLANWDRRFNLDSRGALLFREWLAEFGAAALADAGPLFVDGFDLDRPADTPASPTPVPDAGADPWVIALTRAAEVLADNGIAPNAAVGDAQFVVRGGVRVPIHGANEVEGIANVCAPYGALTRSDLQPDETSGEPEPRRVGSTGLRTTGYPITYGASFVMAVEFTDSGPRAQGLLAYGQSSDPSSADSLAQIRAFSAKRWRPLRFSLDEVAADPNLRQETVTG